MIADPAGTAEALRESLAGLLDAPQTRASRQRADPLGQPPFEPAFLERCRLALSGLLGLDDQGVVEVSSPRRKEGRSSVAAAVATVLARTRGRGGVLLLDLDFARARQADLFATAPAPGLADYLEGRERLRAVRGGPGHQLWLIPAGNHLGDPLRLIQVITMDDLLSVFRERFQWVVLDLPPLLSNPEVARLAGKADWHVIVGRHRRTAVADLRLVRELLGGDERPAGFLLTDDTTRVPEWIRRRL